MHLVWWRDQLRRRCREGMTAQRFGPKPSKDAKDEKNAELDGLPLRLTHDAARGARRPPPRRVARAAGGRRSCPWSPRTPPARANGDEGGVEVAPQIALRRDVGALGAAPGVGGEVAGPVVGVARSLTLQDGRPQIDEADRACKACGGALEEMGAAEESEEIDVLAREFVRKKIVRKKYRCRCGACIETAPLPTRLVPGGRYSLAFAASVAIAKYADHLPLERQTRIMKREGLEVESTTLYDQIERLARVLWPAYDRLGAELLDEPVLFVDETPWPMLGKAETSAKWYAWTMASEKAAYYEIHDSRGLDAAKSLLAGFKGAAVTDGYGVYDALEKRLPAIRTIQCWAHIRRKFVDCETAFPEETEQILALIRELYAIEDRAPKGRDGDVTRGQLRTTESRVVLARMQAWCVQVHCTPGSALAKAIEYMSNRWSKAVRFLDDPRLPLDNNAAERALRGLVLGRKNHYGSKSRRGTEVASADRHVKTGRSPF